MHAADFEYHGFQLGQTAEHLRSKFPQAEQEHNRSNGRYQLWLHAKEQAGPVRYVEALMQNGAVSTLRLSLEKAGRGTFAQRHPLCAPELAQLTRQYGPPGPPATAREERLKSLTYTWKRGSEELSLVCGQFDGSAKSFAMDVLIRHSGR